jgi:hypothetical protein
MTDEVLVSGVRDRLKSHFSQIPEPLSGRHSSSFSQLIKPSFQETPFTSETVHGFVEPVMNLVPNLRSRRDSREATPESDADLVFSLNSVEKAVQTEPLIRNNDEYIGPHETKSHTGPAPSYGPKIAKAFNGPLSNIDREFPNESLNVLTRKRQDLMALATSQMLQRSRQTHDGELKQYHEHL